MKRILKYASFATLALGLMFVATAPSQAAVIIGRGHYIRHERVVYGPVAVAPTVVTAPVVVAAPAPLSPRPCPSFTTTATDSTADGFSFASRRHRPVGWRGGRAIPRCAGTHYWPLGCFSSKICLLWAFSCWLSCCCSCLVICPPFWAASERSSCRIFWSCWCRAWACCLESLPVLRPSLIRAFWLWSRWLTSARRECSAFHFLSPPSCSRQEAQVQDGCRQRRPRGLVYFA